MIFVIHHKEFPFAKNATFQPLHCGKEISDKELYILGDNTGDHISEKNKYVNELTGLYWIWKNYNYKASDFIGICHYRRFFNFNKVNLFLDKYRNADTYKKGDILNFYHENLGDQIKSDLKKYDVILPRKQYWKHLSIKSQYLNSHHEEDWDIMIDVLLNKYPKYKATVDEIENRIPTYCYIYNMFITKPEIFEQFMTWMFDIIFEIEKRIQFRQESYQNRTIGFLAERLTNIYFHHNVYKVKHYQIAFIED
ncbi:DUF4422 domain-containing protein [Flammeovirga sp. MY04]|uniref:DUF4422 domain-containing protein n=1 Tax=Flammeovirga sp. MY04 TaxID=1191459 RepID=UPI0008061634|nr:DUF4422 domain-containing protein [Flammeovirga sp. MY04]ANQ50166.1 DUF4422 domain-containing protein [Flammeovirga sp. MY04]